MKISALTLTFLLSVTTFVSAQCDVDLGRSGSTTPLVLSLQAGVPQSVAWDFTGCASGINDFTVYVAEPRPCPSCRQKALRSNTPLAVIGENLTTGQTTSCPGFTCYFGKVSGDEVQIILLAAKALTVQVTYTANFGGPP